MNKILTPKRVRELSADDYLKEIRTLSQKANVKRTRFIPPKIGSAGFGHFEITYKTPMLVAE